MAICSWCSGSIKGQSHSSGHRAWCQDSSAVVPIGSCSVAIVSDGHGGSKYFRSQIGSQLAVQTSETVIRENLSDLGFLEMLKTDAGTTLSKISCEILDKWQKSVLSYDAEHPLEDWETDYIANFEIKETDFIKRYGATLIVSVLSEDYFFAMQIGDGDLVAVLSDGRIIKPVPSDPRLIDNLTTSLCGKEPLKDFRYCCTFNNVPAAVMISTDGVSTTFSTEENFENYAMNACVYCSTNRSNKLLQDLQRRTTLVNKDDISCAIQYSDQKIIPVIEAFNIKYKGYLNYEANIEKAKTRLAYLRSLCSKPGYYPRKKK